MPADAHARHQDALVDRAETVHPHVGAEHAARDAAPRHDAAGRDHRVERLAAAAARLGEDELRRRRLRLVGAQRPLRIVEVELGVDLAEIHVGVEIGVERADVAPVLRRLLVLVVEPVGVDRCLVDQRRDDVLAEVVVGRLVGVGLEGADQHVGVEDVDTHRGEREIGRARDRARLLRLLLEPGDPLGFVDRDDAEAAGVGDRHLDGRERDRGLALLVEPQHARVVHLVDVIAREHDQVPRVLAHDRIQVLVDRVRGPLVPVLADPLLRRQDLDELAELLGDDAPAHADVAVERQRLVLRRDEDAPQPGVDAVAQREVDDPVRPAEVHRRLGPFLGQRIEPLPGAAGEDDDQAVVEQRRHGMRSAPAQHDACWCAVGPDDPKGEAEHVVDAGLDVAQVQTFDHDGAGAEQHVVRRLADVLELFDR